jgi:pyruvate formate lyase activating enzyme
LEHERTSTPSDSVKEAMLHEKLSDGSVRCNLRAHRCVIARRKRGICHVRENGNESLFTLAYGRIIAGQVEACCPASSYLPGTSPISTTGPMISPTLAGSRVGRTLKHLESSNAICLWAPVVVKMIWGSNLESACKSTAPQVPRIFLFQAPQDEDCTEPQEVIGI